MTKKGLTLLLAGMLTFSTLFVSCQNAQTSGQNATNNEQIQQESWEIKLNANMLTLYVGETYTLTAQKKENGQYSELQDVQYGSEADYVVSVSNGVITANAVGNTYINVKSGGKEAACFVEVIEKTSITASIQLSEETLYKNISQQASVYILLEDRTQVAPESVVWSVDDSSAAQISTTGLIQPLQENKEIVLKAVCTYKGVEYVAEKNVFIDLPVFYAVECNNLMAYGKTVSGLDNTVGTSCKLTVKETDLTNMTNTSVLSVNEYTVETTGDCIEIVQSTDGYTITSKSVGDVMLKITVGQRTLYSPLTVATPISTIADMDALAVASYNDITLLDQDYILVNDIDYEGKSIVPIASVHLEGKGRIGIGAKQNLTMTDGKLSVARNGEATLTDEQFAAFAKKGGINPENVAFSGSFNGNGYSVKNAKMIYAFYHWYFSEKDKYTSDNIHIFGAVSGTLENVAFENVSITTPTGLAVYDGNGALTQETLTATVGNDTDYWYRGASIIGTATGATLNNIFAALRYTSANVADRTSGVLVSIAADSVANNCVLIGNGAATPHIKAAYGLGSSGAVCYNILALNCNGMTMDWGKAYMGAYGNYYAYVSGQNAAVSELLQKTPAAEGYKTIEQTIATYDTKIWDMQRLFAAETQMPSLIKNNMGL